MGEALARERLGRDRIIRDRTEIRETLRTGKAVRTEFFTLRYRLGDGPPGVAFLAGKKVGRAVRRNRARRVLREAFRTSHIDVRGVAALIFIARERAAGADYHEVKRSVEAALRDAADRAG
ncbi:MAG: ribonuclease P protein component [Candidatus Eisenbacteria bacterium]|nr:ribonuclease P protein component [Candidatus Eisenbacteria bacterium]